MYIHNLRHGIMNKKIKTNIDIPIAKTLNPENKYNRLKSVSNVNVKQTRSQYHVHSSRHTFIIFAVHSVYFLVLLFSVTYM